LLPFFILSLEFLILHHNSPGLATQKYLNYWKVIFLFLPTIALIGYIFTHWKSIEVNYTIRSFSLPERLQYEAIILWDYLRQLLAPNILFMGPFHDDTEFTKPEFYKVILASISWFTVISAAFFYRKRSPLLIFALSWFILGHLLESTIFPLELYFEHRNYLPSVGIILALVIGISNITPKKAPYLFALTACLLAFLLVRITSLWNNPLLSAETWYVAHPKSPRATQYLARQQMKHGQDQKGLNTLIKTATRLPSAGDIALQILQAQCALGSDATTLRQRFNNIISSTQKYQASTAIAHATDELIRLIDKGECPELTSNDIEKLITLLLDNEKIKNYFIIVNHLHLQLSMIYRSRKLLSPTIEHLEKAYEVHPTLNTAMLLASTFASGGYYDQALLVLDKALEKLSPHTFFHNKQLESFNKLRNAIKIVLTTKDSSIR
jgi:protein O-mannosyl-transferase